MISDLKEKNSHGRDYGGKSLAPIYENLEV